jgi:transcriptional regulator with XRE-family HTH domain
MRQFDIARQLGVTEQLISKWECGRAEPHIEQAVDIARILGVNPERIFPEQFACGVDEGERPATEKNEKITDYD